jgi:hypothetical protein
MLYRLYSNDSNKEFSWQKVGDKPLFGQTCGPGSFPPRDIYKVSIEWRFLYIVMDIYLGTPFFSLLYSRRG